MSEIIKQLTKAINENDVKTVKYLIKSGVSLYWQDKDDNTSVFSSVSQAKLEIVKLLMKTAISTEDINIKTPLCWAIFNSNTAVAKLLIETLKTKGE
jgi:ankyrin repeat protein